MVARLGPRGLLQRPHFWGAQLFFFSVFIHIFGVFFTAAWRNGRRVTWLIGAILFERNSEHALGLDGLGRVRSSSW